MATPAAQDLANWFHRLFDALDGADDNETVADLLDRQPPSFAPPEPEEEPFELGPDLTAEPPAAEPSRPVQSARGQQAEHFSREYLREHLSRDPVDVFLQDVDPVPVPPSHPSYQDHVAVRREALAACGKLAKHLLAQVKKQ